MKNITLAIFVNFLIINLCFAQDDKGGDFIEFGIRTK